MYDDIGFETDKLMETYSIRIPEITKFQIDRLTRGQKERMNRKILLVIAHTLHESKFEPSLYLKGE